MPKIVINEYDKTKAGIGEYANFSVVVPGYITDKADDTVFDENGIYYEILEGLVYQYKITFVTDNGEIISSVVIKSNNSFPTSFVNRLNSRRFHYVSLRLSSTNDSPQRIYSTSIWAKP